VTRAFCRKGDLPVSGPRAWRWCESLMRAVSRAANGDLEGGLALLRA
jgi:hypothetical protein